MTKFGLCLIAVSGSIALGMPAHALQTDETAASDGTDTTASTEIICRRVPPPTGSRIGGRNICKTRYEWQLIEREARLVAENMGNRNRMDNEEALRGCVAFAGC